MLLKKKTTESDVLLENAESRTTVYFPFNINRVIGLKSCNVVTIVHLMTYFK